MIRKLHGISEPKIIWVSFFDPRIPKFSLRTQPLFLAFDLGLDYERDDDQYIKEAIQTIESRFDLVLITDRFEESVILLKGTDFRSLKVPGSNLTICNILITSCAQF